jgi:hypothetical protein
MVTPRNGRYRRRINSSSDVPRHVQPTPEQSYESSTRDFINPQSGFGPFNDINLGALYRFGKENFGKNVGELLKYKGGDFGIVRAKDKVGQSTSTLESMFALNAVEDIVRNKKVTAQNAKDIAYLGKRTAPPLMAYDALQALNKYVVMPAAIKARKIPKGPTSAYQFILNKLKG